MIKFNLHTHTLFCDGENTPSQIVEKAIEKGFSAIGFSGHIYTDFDTSYCMSPKNTEEYIKEIKRLKNEYGDKIRIYLGIEQDLYAENDGHKYDYKIGSLHYVKKDGVYYSIDSSKQLFEDAIKAFDNDVFKVIDKYYSELALIMKTMKPDIIGHFDLIKKYNDGDIYFSEKDPRYIKIVDSTLEKLLPQKPVFEINTGAMAKGIRKDPYPCFEIVKKIYNGGGKLILSSDCHEKDKLDYAFDEILSSPIGKYIVTDY